MVTGWTGKRSASGGMMPKSFWREAECAHRPVRLRDPVHNFIALREIEVKLLATPLMQRLRGVRQLAMANLVYPGAVHTRFDHSLGVCHVAGLMAECLNLNPDHTELVRLAALLHDLGHGPFSHVSEYALERYANREAIPPDQKKEKIHELVTARLIQHDPDIAHYLSEDMRGQIVRLLAAGHGPPLLRSIVSGPLDADKQDYLLRDSRFCGVRRRLRGGQFGSVCTRRVGDSE